MHYTPLHSCYILKTDILHQIQAKIMYHKHQCKTFNNKNIELCEKQHRQYKNKYCYQNSLLAC